MDTPTEIQEGGIPLDDGPSHYGPRSFFERLPAEFMASGYAVPWSPGDLPQMIPLDLRQGKHVRRDSTICGVGAGLAFMNVKVLHFSEVTPIGYAEALAAVGITEIPGVYYAPGRVPAHVFRHNKVEPGETQTQAPVETADPTPRRRWRHVSAQKIREAIQSLLTEGDALKDASVDKNRYPIIRQRVLELHPDDFPNGPTGLSDSSIYNQLRNFKF
jgi:hypothetical protein